MGMDICVVIATVDRLELIVLIRGLIHDVDGVVLVIIPFDKPLPDFSVCRRDCRLILSTVEAHFIAMEASVVDI